MGVWGAGQEGLHRLPTAPSHMACTWEPAVVVGGAVAGTPLVELSALRVCATAGTGGEEDDDTGSG